MVDPGERSQVTEYAWDYRNRLVAVVNRDAEGGPATQTVEYVHDAYNRLVARRIDADGDGPLAADTAYYVYDGAQILLTLDAAGGVTHRYLWGPAVDQILADESSTGEVLWPLADHLGTARDLARHNAQSETTEVVSHRVYESFGKLLTETAAADHLFAFTARPLDDATDLQNHWHRWYDAGVGRWGSEDPLGFAAGDTDLSRYARNAPAQVSDPTGLRTSTPNEERELDRLRELRASILLAMARDSGDGSELNRLRQRLEQAISAFEKRIEEDEWESPKATLGGRVVSAGVLAASDAHSPVLDLFATLAVVAAVHDYASNVQFPQVDFSSEMQESFDAVSEEAIRHLQDPTQAKRKRDAQKLWEGDLGVADGIAWEMGRRGYTAREIAEWKAAAHDRAAGRKSRVEDGASRLRDIDTHLPRYPAPWENQ